MKKMLAMCILLPLGLYAQDYNVALIPEELKKDADVVVRHSLQEFEVLSPSVGIERYEIALTILSEKGEREQYQVVHYSDLTEILSVEGEIYDATGNRVKKIKKSDYEDVSASGSNMYSDNRMKVLDFKYHSYPYTVVFKYQVKDRNMMFLSFLVSTRQFFNKC